MKLLSFLLLLVCSLSAQAQDAKYPGYARLPLEAGKVTYTAVIPVEGATKEELFTRAKEWSARAFRDNKVAERMNDREAGTLIAQCSWQQPPLSFTDTHANLYRFVVAIYAKDGRYMYRIDEFTYQNINPALITKDAKNAVGIEYYATQKPAKKMDVTLRDFDEKMKTLIADLNNAMRQPAATTKDW